MNKLKTIVLLAVVSCLPGAAGAMDMNMAKSSSDNLMWLAPMSWDDLRAQRDKAKKMNEASGKPMEGMKSMEGMGKSGTDRKQRAKDDNNNKKKRSEASASMRRMYYIRSGAFPEVPKSQNPMAKPMAKQDVMSHDGMKMQGADMGQMSMDKGMDNTILWVKFPDNSVQNFKARQRGPALLASFPSGDGGWHTLFAYNDMGVKDGSRVHLLSH
ncbi:MAG: hypothetical protein KAI27_00310, partial [Rhodospirillaceae bacterium]|nr:hypothetical protein [Rhodospirillaceae bacterium]